MKTSEESLRDLQDYIKQINICIMGVSEGEKGEKGTQSLFDKIMAENFPKLRKEMEFEIQEAQNIPTKNRKV